MKNNLEDIRSEFAKAFINAFSRKSIEKCNELLVSYDDHLYLLSLEDNDFLYLTSRTFKPDITRTEYDKVISKQTETFLNTANEFIDKRSIDENSRIDFSNLKEINTYNFETNNEPLQSIKTISISLKPRLLDGINYQVGFQIDDAIFIGGRIKITNWYCVKFYESFSDDINKSNTPYTKIEDKDKLNKIFENLDYEYCDYIHNWQWYLHEGDLVLEKYDLKVNLIITGNLTIKESLSMIGHELVVFGKTTLNALHLDESNNVLFINGIEFKVGIFAEPWSSGAFQVFNKPKGPLIYSRSETTEIDDFKDIQYYQDANTEGTSDLCALINNKFLIETDDGYFDFDRPDNNVLEAIKAGENIFI